MPISELSDLRSVHEPWSYMVLKTEGTCGQFYVILCPAQYSNCAACQTLPVV